MKKFVKFEVYVVYNKLTEKKLGRFDLLEDTRPLMEESDLHIVQVETYYELKDDE